MGRRPVYLAAAVINVVAITAYALAQSFWAFVVAGALMGAFRALDSGPLEAWLVDTVHETTPGADVDRQLSRAGSILGVAIAVGAVLSGLLIWWNPAATVFGNEDASAARRRRLGVGGPVRRAPRRRGGRHEGAPAAPPGPSAPASRTPSPRRARPPSSSRAA